MAPKLTNSNTLRVKSAQVCVLKKRNKIRLNSFLKSAYSRRLEADIRLELLGDLSNETLEG